MLSRVILLAAGTLLGSSCAAPQRFVEPAPDLESLVGTGARAPQSAIERALLPRLGDEPAGREVTLSGHRVELGPVYSAASGRRCRAIYIDTESSFTACLIDESWAFVPQVSASEGRSR